MPMPVPKSTHHQESNQSEYCEHVCNDKRTILPLVPQPVNTNTYAVCNVVKLSITEDWDTHITSTIAVLLLNQQQRIRN